MEGFKSDLDKIMEFLQSLDGQDATLDSISKNTGIERSRARRWVHLLEERKQVRIRYELTTERVRWLKKTAEPKESAHGSIDENDEKAYPKPSVLDSNFYSVSGPARSGEKKPAGAGQPPIFQSEPVDLALAAQEEEEYGRKKQDEQERRLARAAFSQIQKMSPSAELEAERGLEEEEKEEENALLKFSVGAQEVKKGGKPPMRKEELPASPAKGEQELPPRLIDADFVPKTGASRPPGSFSSLPKDGLGSSGPVFAPSAFTLQTGPRVLPRPKLEMTPLDVPPPAQIDFVPQIKLPPMPKADPKFSSANQKLELQMKRIASKSRQIQRLEDEKRKLLVQTYQPLEQKLNDDLQAVSDKLLQYDKRILDLHAHAAHLPDEMESAARLQQEMTEVATQLQQVYDETTHVVHESLASLGESRENMQRQVELIHQGVRGEEQHLGQMAQIVNQLGAMQAEVEARLEEARTAILDEQASLQEAQGKLELLTSVKTGLETELASTGRTLRSQKNTLSELENHMGRLDEVRRWVQTNRVQYEQKMQTLADYIRNAEGDYAALKESIDSSFARRYLKELRTLSVSYEYEYAQAQRLEESIEQRISKSKGQIAVLIEQAKHIADMQDVHLEEISQDAQERAHEGLARQDRLEKAFLRDKGRLKTRELILKTIEQAPQIKEDGKTAGAQKPARKTGAKKTGKKRE